LLQAIPMVVTVATTANARDTRIWTPPYAVYHR
jgi:hypothetical protein